MQTGIWECSIHFFIRKENNETIWTTILYQRDMFAFVQNMPKPPNRTPSSLVTIRVCLLKQAYSSKTYLFHVLCTRNKWVSPGKKQKQQLSMHRSYPLVQLVFTYLLFWLRFPLLYKTKPYFYFNMNGKCTVGNSTTFLGQRIKNINFCIW